MVDINQVRERFFDFEKNNRLFEIKDNKGMPIWDIIRPIVFEQLINSGTGIIISRNRTKIGVGVRIRQLFRFVLYFLATWNKKYFFYLCSRNYDGKEYFDRIADSSIRQLNLKDIYKVESFGSELKKEYRYGLATPPMVGLARRYMKVTFDFESIKEKLVKAFPESQINKEAWISEYRFFYAQYYFYSFLFRIKRIRKCFLVQNQYQKGMIASANKCGIPIIEFQHGEMTANHLAYSYPPDTNLTGKIYVPSVLLTLGDFWMQDCFMPGVKIRAIGNDFYHVDNAGKKISGKDVLIISSNIHGEYLKELVLNVIEKKNRDDIKFYFKLHPNEFEQYEVYVETFRNYPNVEVISGSQMVKDLLTKVAFVVCVESTVEFEALSAGVKVMIYKRGDYQYVSSLFDEEGVYLIDNEEDFVDTYESNKDRIIRDYSDYFFKSYNPQVIEECM